ncbi:MAG TPA: aminopeptidase [Solirubrobacteraceae bacterium]|jgi:aminopeptidase|nr:aminopeptidase [Solirubrobacteraceae bacterium]
MGYEPERVVLERYARLLVEFALGHGNGIQPGDVVQINGNDACKPLYVESCKAVWRAGGHVIHAYRPSEDENDDVRRAFYEMASDEQIGFLPDVYERAMVDQVDHGLWIYSPSIPRSLDGIDPARQMAHESARKKVRDWEQEKENRGGYTWTVASYGTAGMAAEAEMSADEYWAQIIRACFLDQEDPVERWREVRATIGQTRERLNALPIERMHVNGPDADLWIGLGEDRQWKDGVGANMPSFELFTSPDWRGTEGWIRFSEPLYAFGSLIKGVELEFRGGRVARAMAAENEPLLHEMIATENADKVGEFSLTDARLSPIDRFMADTLYDENVGGPYGNTHLALGNAYQDTYLGDPASLSSEDWERLGFNESAIHTDIVSTADRTVTARLRDGSERVIYADGQFQLDEVDA